MIRKVLLVSVVCLVVGTACGNSSDPLSLIKNSGARAASAKTAKISMTVTTTAQGQSFSLDGAGVADFNAKAVQFSFDFGKMFQAIGGQLPSGMPTTFEFVFAENSMYFKAPPGAGFSASKPWLKINLKDLSGAAGTQSFSSDPRGFLDALKGVSGGIKKTGNENVRGVETTIYKGSIDIQKALAQVPAERRAQLQSLLKQYGTKDFPVTVWVGKDGRTYRMVIEETLPGLGSATVKLEFFDYGKPVTVHVPTDAESTPISAQEFQRLLSL
jgi:hypothetical protein